MDAPPQSIFFHFHAVSGVKSCQIIGFCSSSSGIDVPLLPPRTPDPPPRLNKLDTRENFSGDRKGRMQGGKEFSH